MKFFQFGYNPKPVWLNFSEKLLQRWIIVQITGIRSLVARKRLPCAKGAVSEADWGIVTLSNLTSAVGINGTVVGATLRGRPQKKDSRRVAFPLRGRWHATRIKRDGWGVNPVQLKTAGASPRPTLILCNHRKTAVNLNRIPRFFKNAFFLNLNKFLIIYPLYS